MTPGDLLTISPLIALTLTPVIVMLAAAFKHSHALALALTLIGLAAAGGLLAVSAGRSARQVTPLLSFDTYALFFAGLIIAEATKNIHGVIPLRTRPSGRRILVDAGV